MCLIVKSIFSDINISINFSYYLHGMYFSSFNFTPSVLLNVFLINSSIFKIILK